MNEDLIQFAEFLRSTLIGLRTSHQLTIAGQVTFEKRIVNNVLRVVVTNVGGKYNFDIVSDEPLNEVDFDAETGGEPSG
jgi:hypothetical protein